MTPPVSPIRTVRYPEGTTVLWRWTERPEDRRIAAFVAAFAAARARVQARTRASLDAGDIDTIIGYARRCALAAVRTGDPGRVVSAFDALSAVDTARADSHDLAFAVLALAGAATCVGLPVRAAAAGAMRRADPRVARMVTSVASRPAQSSGYRRVELASGPVLLFGGPAAYRPDRDLVPIALRLADAFEAEGTYRIHEVTIGDRVPAGWIGDPALADGSTGCVSLRGAAADHLLLAYVGESPAAGRAAAVAEGAEGHTSTTATVLGVAEGRLCAVVVSKCLREGAPPIESRARFARFRPTVRALLREGLGDTSET